MLERLSIQSDINIMGIPYRQGMGTIEDYYDQLWSRFGPYIVALKTTVGDPYNLSARMFPHELNEYLLWVDNNGNGECQVSKPVNEPGTLVTVQTSQLPITILTTPTIRLRIPQDADGMIVSVRDPALGIRIVEMLRHTPGPSPK